MKEVTIYRHEDGTARGTVWNRSQPTVEELSPKNAVYITYMMLPNEFCDFLKHETKERVSQVLESYICR